MDTAENGNIFDDYGNLRGTSGGGGGIGVRSSYYAQQNVRAYDAWWQNSCYNPNMTWSNGAYSQETSTALQTYYPPNGGFSGTIQRITLEAGTLIQRTGLLNGTYAAPANTPLETLSLPYNQIGQPTTILQIQRPVEVLAGYAAAWFGQIGGGIQCKFGMPIDQLVAEGVMIIWGILG